MAKYVVNAGGVINSVPDEVYATHMAVMRQTAMQRRATPDAAPVLDTGEAALMPREATAEEIAAWWAKQGLVYLPETDEAVSKAEAAERSRKPAATTKNA